MKFVRFLFATTLLCQIVIESSALRRRRRYTDTPYASLETVGLKDYSHRPSQWQNSNQQRVSQLARTESYSYDADGFKRGDLTDGSRGVDMRIITKGQTSTSNKGYTGWVNLWNLDGTRVRDPDTLQSDTKTTLSIDIAECMKSCPVTAEHNPVCGSNNVTYTNPGRLECAQRCGVEVVLGRWTACSVHLPALQEKPVNREDLVACLRKCPISDVFSPVCGSNNRTYENPERLICEQGCGIMVQLIKLSPCFEPKPTTTENNEDPCLRSCSVTAEFNPVCGSNNITYNNPGHLECAQSCGVVVQLSRNASCTAPLTADVITRSTSESNQILTTISTSDRPYLNGNGGGNFNWNNKEETTETASGGNSNGNNDDFATVNGHNNMNTERSFTEFVDENSSNDRTDTSIGNDINAQEFENGANHKNNSTKKDIFNGSTNKNYENNGNAGDGKPESKGYYGGGGSYGGNSANSGNGFNGGHGGNNGNNGHGSNNCNGVNNHKTPNMKEVISCMQSCSLTNEFNPVCGTDAITYTNPGRLLCAQFCGIDVKVKKFASCSSSSTTNLHCPIACTNPPVTGNIETSTPTSPSPAQACMDSCPASIEFKPVCGSNNITYRNIEQLQCAKRCGINVSLQRNTRCSTPAANPESNSSNGITPVWSYTKIPSIPTTSKPDGVRECMNQCSISGRYEPICGSDNVTYNNTGHLLCARKCGRDISIKRLYPCPEDETPLPKPTTEKNQVSTSQNNFDFTIPSDVLANIWSETTPKNETEVDEFDLDQRVQD